MKIATSLSYAGGFLEAAEELRELERAGLDTVWVAEASGFDAPSLMGFLAAKTEAEAAIPRSFIDATTLIGPEGFVREQLAAYKESGVTNLNVSLVGQTTAERVATLDKLNEIVATV
jgi:hypothetical protein